MEPKLHRLRKVIQVGSQVYVSPQIAVEYSQELHTKPLFEMQKQE